MLGAGPEAVSASRVAARRRRPVPSSSCAKLLQPAGLSRAAPPSLPKSQETSEERIRQTCVWDRKEGGVASQKAPWHDKALAASAVAREVGIGSSDPPLSRRATRRVLDALGRIREPGSCPKTRRVGSQRLDVGDEKGGLVGDGGPPRTRLAAASLVVEDHPVVIRIEEAGVSP
eukprot:scaffold17084_cov130-Isochrysis_galbana.AAC.6